MDISLTSDLEQYVTEKVESGSYPSASQVIREGLKLLKERDDTQLARLEELRREIQIGIDQADRGQVSTFDEKTLEEIKANGGKLRFGDRSTALGESWT